MQHPGIPEKERWVGWAPEPGSPGHTTDRLGMRESRTTGSGWTKVGRNLGSRHFYLRPQGLQLSNEGLGGLPPACLFMPGFFVQGSSAVAAEKHPPDLPKPPER